MAEWFEVRALMAEGRHLPVRGRVTAHRNSRVHIAHTEGVPFLPVSLHPEGLDLARAGDKLRLDRIDGTRHVLVAGGRVWDFSDDPGRPMTTQLRFASFIGPGFELVATSEMIDDLFQRFPSGPVREGQRMGRPVWVVHGELDDVAVELAVDQDTGVVVAVAAVDGEWSAEFASIEFPERIAPENFQWSGDSAEAQPLEIADREDGNWTADPAAPTAPEQCSTTNRILAIRIDDWLLSDGSVDLPRVGETVEWPLEFHPESDAAPGGDPGLKTLRAEATPIGDGPFRAQSGGRLRWATHLQGDGWSAKWDADRPVVGAMVLSGTLWIDSISQAVFPPKHARTRGRICRVRVKVERQRKVSGPIRSSWETIAESERWIDMETSPSVFGYPEFSKVQLDGTREYPVDLVVDLDLDSVSPVEPRPRVVPGDAAVCGHVLWVADDRLPLVAQVDLAGSGSAVETALPLPVVDPGVFTRIYLSVFPDTSGCWVLDGKSRYRIELDAADSTIDPQPLGSWSACAYDGRTMLVLGEHSAVIDSDGQRHPVELPAWDSSPVVALRRDSDPHFVVALDTPADPTRPHTFGGRRARDIYRIAMISDGGDVTVGPEVEFDGAVRAVGIVDGQIWVVGPTTTYELADDLSVRSVRRLPKAAIFETGFVGDQMWVLVHHPRRPDQKVRWPYREGEEQFSENDGLCLFALLELPSLEPVGKMAINSENVRVTLDDRGTVWISGQEIRGLRPDGTATGIDISSTLDCANGAND